MRAIEADGRGHGGQRSAAIYIRKPRYPLVDLRADDYDEPVVELRRLYDFMCRAFPIIAGAPQIHDRSVQRMESRRVFNKKKSPSGPAYK